MKFDRRLLIRSLLAVSATFALPRILFGARPDKAFDAGNSEAALTDLFGESPVASDRIVLKIPDIAENGAVVPVTVSTDLENVESISVLVDKNPTPLAASFDLSSRSLPSVSVRIKMGQTSPVHAVVRADGVLYSTTKNVKVTIGGCGG